MAQLPLNQAGQTSPEVQAAPEGQVAPESQSGDQAAPEEQEAYERTVLAGIKALSDPKSNPQIMQMLGSGKDDPAKTMASVTNTIMMQLDEQSGGTIPEVVILPASAEILENVAEFANESGVIKVDKPMQDKAAQYLVMDLAEAYDIPPEDVQELMAGVSEQDMGKIVEEQSAVASSGAKMPQAAPQAVPQAAPQQQLPGIINQTIGA